MVAAPLRDRRDQAASCSIPFSPMGNQLHLSQVVGVGRGVNQMDMLRSTSEGMHNIDSLASRRSAARHYRGNFPPASLVTYPRSDPLAKGTPPWTQHSSCKWH